MTDLVTQPESAQAPDTITTVIDELPAVIKESKAGYRTTEFWVTIAIAVLTLLGSLPLPPHYQGVVVAALAAAYALSRGIAKTGVPSVEAAPDA